MKKITSIVVLLIMAMVYEYSLPQAAHADSDAEEDAMEVTVTDYSSDELPFDPYEGGIAEARNISGEREFSMANVVKSITTLDLGTADPLTIILMFIVIGLSLLATAFMILLLYAGFLWVWARGNTETIEKAKKLIIQGVIGLVIILGSLGIAQLIFFVINTVTT